MQYTQHSPEELPETPAETTNVWHSPHIADILLCGRLLSTSTLASASADLLLRPSSYLSSADRRDQLQTMSLLSSNVEPWLQAIIDALTLTLTAWVFDSGSSRALGEQYVHLSLPARVNQLWLSKLRQST
ncbi:hypothetical protein V1514DRAFT_322262 [Lipomyces japonicus]|uniref:uncharacterized protein n=1 Tax=Lipomyces japonicus TaxID=56871 RepID=UPI0034D01E9A